MGTKSEENQSNCTSNSLKNFELLEKRGIMPKYPKWEENRAKFPDVEKSSKLGTKTDEHYDICASNLITNLL